MRIVRLNREWNCYPLWITGATDDIPQNIDAAALQISKSLQSRIAAWQKPIDDYYAVMETIAGGGWSRHTLDEFEAARNDLGVVFPTKEDDEVETQIIYQALQKELPDDRYIVEVTDTLGGQIF